MTLATELTQKSQFHSRVRSRKIIVGILRPIPRHDQETFPRVQRTREQADSDRGTQIQKMLLNEREILDVVPRVVKDPMFFLLTRQCAEGLRGSRLHQICEALNTLVKSDDQFTKKSERRVKNCAALSGSFVRISWLLDTLM